MHANFKTQYRKHQKGISIFGQQQAMLKIHQDIIIFDKNHLKTTKYKYGTLSFVNKWASKYLARNRQCLKFVQI